MLTCQKQCTTHAHACALAFSDAACRRADGAGAAATAGGVFFLIDAQWVYVWRACWDNAHARTRRLAAMYCMRGALPHRACSPPGRRAAPWL